MTKTQRNRALSLATIFLLIAIVARSQFSLTGQLRTRTEVRNGVGNLVLKGSKSAAFTSQRTRLSFGYKWDRLTFGVSVQDVRVWGQDASSISNADGSKLMLHEGWADLTLLNNKDSSIKIKALDLLTLKIGRQELVYDDSRLIGNLDWLQQARRHDMALLKMLHKGWQADLGVAFNQNSDAFGVTGTSYVPSNVAPYVKNSLGLLVPTPTGLLPMAPQGNAGNNSTKSGAPVWLNPPTTNGGNQDYKSFTSVYISKKIKETKISALFFNDNFGKYKMDSVGNASTGYVYGRRFSTAGPSDEFDYTGTHHRYTYGLMLNQAFGNESGLGKIALQAAYYAQSGKNRDGVKMKSASHYSIAASYIKGKFSLTPGYDVLSGNNAATTEDEKFDPLYGTPHRHWGFMDFFYVGTGSPSGGLQNPYLKLKYSSNSLTAGLDVHLFYLDENMTKADGSQVEKYLGNEIDLVINYSINKYTNLELGYSLMKATQSMPFAKGQATTNGVAESYRKSGTWFYGMLRFSPDFLFQKPAVKKT